MAKMVDRTAAVEHRTRSELVREALRWYIDRIPVAALTAKEAAADQAGRVAFSRGDFAMLEEIVDDMARRRRRIGKKAASQGSRAGR
jgi:predicted transcriptional regulator